MKVDLKLISKSPHTSGIITGFLMLADQGRIELSIHTDFAHAEGAYPFSHLVQASVEGKSLVFDLLDGYNWRLEAVERLLDETDFYFKRSFSPQKNQMISEKNRGKLHPLGFSYHVTHPGNPIDRCEGMRESIEQMKQRILNGNSRKAFTCDRMEAPADEKEINTAMFLVRLWEMTGNEDIDWERRYINEMRMDIIRKLRKLYSDRFIGGVQISPYAIKQCRELVIGPGMSNRKKYLQAMKQADVCIGSMGLYESIGWKTGEYIAASRAIVNEKLHYEVTGDFTIGKNYLPFETVEECVEQTVFLMEHPDLVYEMKKENEAYYHDYLRPDKQVSNALAAALETDAILH